MADYETLFPGRFVRASDLGPTEKTVTIKSVRAEEIDGKMKVVISFVGASKEFVCNRTNAEHIKIMLGREVDQWLNKQVTLHQVIIEDPFSKEKGATVPCIRVKGSPHIEKPMHAEVKRGRKTIFVSVVPTGKSGAAAAAPASKTQKQKPNGPPPPMSEEDKKAALDAEAKLGEPGSAG
jgi:hypothetical protein